MNEAEAPTGFEISLEDLLGGRVPNNHDPKDVILFSFKILVTVSDFPSHFNSCLSGVAGFALKSLPFIRNTDHEAHPLSYE